MKVWNFIAAAGMALAIFLSFASGAGGNMAKSRKSPIATMQMNPLLKSPITLKAQEANLSEVLKVLSERSGMNFVAGSGVQKEKITIILNQTPLDEAINLLVRAAGLSYEIIGNSVLIAEPEKLKEEVGLSGYVVDLKYAQAPEAAKMLADLSKNIKVDGGGNRLICYTSPRVILEIEKIIKATDHPHILVLLETRLIEVSLDNLDQYGIQWSTFSPVRMTINAPEAPIKDGFSPDSWSRLSMDFNLALDMLLNKGEARILMDSKLSTTNNREASLHVGEVVPYTIQMFNAGVAGGASMQIQKEYVGVKVVMTPHVNEENQITIRIEPEVSTIIGWKGANADLPLVRVRTTNTTIRVEDNQTIFLAGLLSEEVSDYEYKLPILGHIPLGRLFTHKRKEIKKKNLVIEITPKIIRDPRELTMPSTRAVRDEKKRAGAAVRPDRSQE
jgi:type II secretory pathway component GspD/PulD (secretin)